MSPSPDIACDPCLGRNVIGFRHRADEFQERILFLAIYERWPSWADRLKRLRRLATGSATELRRKDS